MSSNLNTALRIGTSGLQISQLALATVSHNVVNANTAGYSRQVVQTSASSVGGFGNGVQLDTIQRVTDSFITSRTLDASSDSTFSSTKKSYLDTIQSIFSTNGTSGGIDSTITGFMSSLSQLSDDPTNTALRRNVVQQAALVAETLRSANTSLQSTANNADLAINSEITNSNQLIRDIATLNTQIAALTVGTAGTAGASANDLIDQRDLKISALAQEFKIQVATNSDTGSVRITTENGRTLVNDTAYAQLTRTVGAGTYQGIGVQNVQVDGTLGSTIFPINTDTLTSGKFKALIDIRDSNVPALLSQLDTLSTTMISAVNQVSSQGSSYPPVNLLTSGSTSGVSSTSGDLFTELSNGLAGSTFNISVVDSQGDPVVTTAGGTPITIPSTGTFSLDDLATLINNNAAIGNTALGGTAGIIATSTTDTSGKPSFTIQAANSNYRVVLSNVSGDVLGTLGMNNLFTGSGANSIAVRSDILSNPDLLPTARMRSSDGGLSSQNNENILALSQIADTTLTFPASGGLGTQSVTAVGYAGQILSNLAVTVADAKDRETFTENISNQLQGLASSISGVNINEELSNMLVYQNSFQASARIISVVSDMMDTLMGIIR
ncbi:MAG: flagellar hook-associated protein FlgK [Proteobacteria bacterium]|nr:flagellar hook-associated protein FlgK [Pseudomonadota bacterium]